MENLNEIRNSFEQELFDNGYKTFKASFKSALRGFQKRVRDKKGTKYFITIWHYNHSEQFGRDDIPKGDTYMAENQFKFDKDNKDNTCNVEYWGDVLPNEWRETTTLKDIEDFFESFWKKMKPEYYESY